MMRHTPSKKIMFATLATLFTGLEILGSFLSPAPASAGILDAILQPSYNMPYYSQPYRAPYVAYGYNRHYSPRSQTVFGPVLASGYGHPCRVSYYNNIPRGRALGYYNTNHWNRRHSHHHD